MKYRILFLSAIAAIVFFSAGCSKDDDNNTPADSPGVITITTPAANTTYINGSILQVRGNVTDNNALSTARVEIKNNATNAILYQQNQSTGNVTYYGLNWDWTVTGITSATNATVKITVTDRYNNQVTKDIPVVLID
jgi:hypothetical protein